MGVIIYTSSRVPKATYDTTHGEMANLFGKVHNSEIRKRSLSFVPLSFMIFSVSI